MNLFNGQPSKWRLLLSPRSSGENWSTTMLRNLPRTDDKEKLPSPSQTPSETGAAIERLILKSSGLCITEKALVVKKQFIVSSVLVVEWRWCWNSVHDAAKSSITSLPWIAVRGRYIEQKKTKHRVKFGEYLQNALHWVRMVSQMGCVMPRMSAWGSDGCEYLSELPPESCVTLATLCVSFLIRKRGTWTALHSDLWDADENCPIKCAASSVADGKSSKTRHWPRSSTVIIRKSVDFRMPLAVSDSLNFSKVSLKRNYNQ